jgi:hypothetical protein
MKTTTTTTATTCPAAAGLALASLAAELLIQGLAALLLPLIALVLALAGCGHELALAARRRRDAMAAAAAAEPAVKHEEAAAAEAEPASFDTEPDWELGDRYAAAELLRETQVQVYRDLAGLAARELRQLARAAGHRQLARQGRRGELLAALVPA